MIDRFSLLDVSDDAASKNLSGDKHEQIARDEQARGNSSAVVDRVLANTDATYQILGVKSETEGTFFEYGTEVTSGKDERRAAHEAMPLLSLQVANYRATVNNERRTDVILTSKDIAYLGNGDGTAGRLQNTLTGKIAAVTPIALGQLLAGRFGAPTAACTVLAPEDKGAALPVEMQSQVFGAYASQAKTKKGGPVGVKAVARVLAGEPQIFHIGSPRTSTVSGADIAEMFERMYPGARGRVKYTADTTRWRAEVEDLNPAEPVVGDVHKLITYVGSIDNGTGSIYAGQDAERVRCVNLSTILMRCLREGVRHNAKDLQEQIAALLAQIAARRGQWITATADSWTNEIASNAQELGIEAVFTALVEKRSHGKRVIQFDSEASDETTVAALMTAWHTEPGYTKAHVLQAMTKAAQSPWANPWAREDVAQQAGQLLYMRQLVTPAEIAAAV